MVMGSNVKKRRQTVRYSESFKRARIAEYESGELSVRQISRLYQVSFQSIYRWLDEYSTYPKKGIIVVEQSESTSEKVKQLEAEVDKLKSMVGDKQILLEYYQALISQAEQAYGIEIEKNSATQR